eukprot:2794777-Rhodomonas_salina.2
MKFCRSIERHGRLSGSKCEAFCLTEKTFLTRSQQSDQTSSTMLQTGLVALWPTRRQELG